MDTDIVSYGDSQEATGPKITTIVSYWDFPYITDWLTDAA